MGNETGAFSGSQTTPYFPLSSGNFGWGKIKNDRLVHPLLLGDVNGDGLTDVVGVRENYVQVGLGASGTISQPQTFLRTEGREEVVYIYGNGDIEEDFVFPPLFPGFSLGADQVSLSDINGDGRADLVALSSGSIHIAFSRGDHFTPFVRMHSFLHASSGWTKEKHQRFIADLNGDGRGDFLGIKGGKVYSLLYQDGEYREIGAQRSLFFSTRPDNHLEHPTTLGDVNGDGALDLVYFASGGVRIAMGRGDGSFRVLSETTIEPVWGDFDSETMNDEPEQEQIRTSYTVLTHFGESQRWENEDHIRTLADVNGDGRADIVGFKDNRVYIALAQPLQLRGNVLTTEPMRNGIVSREIFKYPTSHDLGFTGSSWDVEENPRMLADIDGNGSADVIGFSRSGMRIARNRYTPHPPRLVAVTEGFDLTTEITYAQLSDTSVYTLRAKPATPNCPSKMHPCFWCPRCRPKTVKAAGYKHAIVMVGCVPDCTAVAPWALPGPRPRRPPAVGSPGGVRPNLPLSGPAQENHPVGGHPKNI